MRIIFNSEAMKVVFMFVFVTKSYSYSLCPETSVCNCSDTSLTCKCDSRQDFDLHPIHDDKIKNVYISGCGSVRIPLGSLSHLALDRLELIDIHYLNIGSFAFHEVSIKSIKIAEIGVFPLTRYMFAALYDLQSLVISNVNAITAPKNYYIIFASMDEFVIQNSSFNFSEFIFANTISLKIIDVKFKDDANISFIIHNTRNVNFVNTTIFETGNSSFLATNVDNIVFDKCDFRVMETSFLVTRNVSVVSFYSCNIFRMKSEAFSLTNVTEALEFTNNVIHYAQENFIVNADTLDSTRIIFSHNKFTCNCDISWMWINNEKGIYNYIMNSSSCLNLEKSSLSSIVPILNSKNECLNLTNEKVNVKSYIKTYNDSGGFNVTALKSLLLVLFVITKFNG